MHREQAGQPAAEAAAGAAVQEEKNEILLHSK
jgi:hypothetical protein